MGTEQWKDKKLLEQWLQPHYGKVTVDELEIENATGKGDNLLSNVQRMTVKTDSGDCYILIVKCHIDQGKAAKIMSDSIMFKKEQEIYNNIIPRIHTMLQNALPGTFEPITPKGIYSCESFIILEDISLDGFKMQERRNGLDLNHCLLVMRCLAKFHAASVILYKEDPDSMKEFEVSFFYDPPVKNNWSRYYEGMIKVLIEEMKTWPEEWEHYIKKLEKFSDNIMKRLQIVTAPNQSGLNVLTHGDLWVNNILYKQHPRAVRLIDFQLSHFTSPAVDFHYFLATSPTLDVRVNHTGTLLKEYHSTLCNTLTALGYSEKLITLQELNEEYDRTALYGLFCGVVLSSVMECEPDCGFSFDDALISGLTPGPSMLSENYKTAIKWCLPMYEKKGVFSNL